MSDKELDNRTLAQVLDDEKFGPDDAAMSDKELKPCPHLFVEKEVGHRPYIVNEDGLWRVHCSCGAAGPISGTRDCAIKAWNTRTEPEWEWEHGEQAWIDITKPHDVDPNSFLRGFNAARELK